MPYKPTGGKPGRPRKVSEAKRKALQRELAKFVSLAKAPWISKLTLGQLALGLGVTRQLVHKWRRDPHYHQEFIRLFSDEIVRSLKGERRPRSPILARSKNRDARFAGLVHKHWVKPLWSPLDNKVYRDPDAYIKHAAEWSYAVTHLQIPPNDKRPRQVGRGSSKLKKKGSDWSTTAVWAGDKPNEWFKPAIKPHEGANPENDHVPSSWEDWDPDLLPDTPSDGD